MTIGPATICRQAPEFIRALEHPAARGAALRGSMVVVVVGSAFFGFSFGCWRSTQQAAIAAAKMPILLFAVMATAGLANSWLAAIICPGLTRAQIGYGFLSGFAVTAAVLGAFAPVTAFFALQAPSIDGPDAMSAYRGVFLAHVAAVGTAGVLGFLRLRQLLLALTGSPAVARRILFAWIGTAGLCGCEWSWLLSPFLSRPDQPVPWINPDAFTCNFFEYVWRVVAGNL